MSITNPFAIQSPRPICLGTGLVVLDVVIDGKNKPQLATGGSCGNVLSILGSMGWSSYPIARIGDDKASEIMLKDMAKWGVRTDFVHRNGSISTPIIIERILAGDSPLTHTFEFSCPKCGSSLPRNRLIDKQLFLQIEDKLPRGQVFYFDRISRTILDIARKKKAEGSVIMFEPCRHRRGKLFEECLKVADIIKYASEELEGVICAKDNQLEIQTLGSKGSRFRIKKNGKKYDWKLLPAFKIDRVLDTAGAGDLCSAGILHILGQEGAKGFLRASYHRIEEAIRFGQALSALGCSFKGARGHMYNLAQSRIEALAFAIMNDEIADLHNYSSQDWNNYQYLCPSCK